MSRPHRSSFLARLDPRMLASLVALAALAAAGCEQGAEGDRCNIDLVDSTECNSGLGCVVPSSCVVAVCCPLAPPYTDPNCECFANPGGAVCRQQGCNVDASYDAGTPPDASGASTLDAGGDGSHG